MLFRSLYQLENIPTFIRTTLRHEDFCKGWHVLVQLGLTDPTDREKLANAKTYKDWIDIKIKSSGTQTDFAIYIATLPEKIQEQIRFLELDKEEGLPNNLMSSADILQSIIENKLVLKSNDRDMIIMQHEIRYQHHQHEKLIQSTLVVKGEDQEHTAMAKTVGLPLGIAAK